MSNQTYGWGYRGMDPRNFQPDLECCTPEEIAAWQKARKQAEAGEPWDDPHPARPFTTGSKWGIGVVTWPDDDGPGGGERVDERRTA